MTAPSSKILPAAALLCACSFAPAPAAAEAPPRPNVVWITAEDMSLTLGSYGDAYATTPHLDRFAAESVRYTRAFASAPVCSPARSSLITGVWAPSLGTSQMRSAYPIPSEITGFPAFLREAGYYTSNDVKTDYNTADEPRLIEESWDSSRPGAHWRDAEREEGQPFFAVFNQMLSHQSRTMVWPYEVFQELVQSELEPEQVHDPAAAPVPPYYPDTEIVRREIARFYDCVTAMDREVGRLLDELEEDGLAEDTIVFFFSDHGSGMPRHKRLLHDSGMQVPLLVRFPERYRHLAPTGPGETVDGLVTFVDLPPTLLSLLGLEVPDYMQGRIFLGPGAGEDPEYIYGFRDRVDEAFDLARSVRSERWLYIRNYMPHLSWMQPSVFCDTGEIRQELNRHARGEAGELTPPQRAFMGPTRPVEEFYDTEADPENLRNLLEGELDGEQSGALEAHRAAFAEMRRELLDLGVLPECLMVDYILEESAPMRSITLGQTDHRPDLDAAWAAADLVGTGTRDELLAMAFSGEFIERYWGVLGLRHAFPADEELIGLLRDHLDDFSAPVRLETAFWAAEASDEHRLEALQVLGRELFNEHWWTALRACRAVELLGEKARTLLPVMQRLHSRTRHGEGDANLFMSFSSGAWLRELGEPYEPWDFSPGGATFTPAPPPEGR